MDPVPTQSWQPTNEPATSSQADPGAASTTDATGAAAVSAPPGPAATAFTDRYQELRFHDRGGLGEVFVVRDAALHREVALKRMRPERADDPESRRRFLLEAELTGRLEHPGVVPVHDLTFDAQGQPCYTMRFIEGESLKDAVRHFHEADTPGRDPGERSLALRQLLGRFIAVCNAVAFAHSRGILHRDIKPGNIMLGRYGETLLLDWGLAKQIGVRGQESGVRGQESGVTDAGEEGLSGVSDSGPLSPDPFPMTQAGRIIGTPGYMSPEQAAGRSREVSPVSDVYSLGATLFTLLTGRAPYPGKDLLQFLRLAQGDALPRARQVKSAVPRALEAICGKAMALRPEDRYASAKALAEDIEHWLADEPVRAFSEALPARLGRWARRHRPLVAGAGALALTATLGLAVGLWALDRERARTVTERDQKDEALRAEARRRRETRAALDSMSSQIVEDWLAQSKSKDLTPQQKRFLQQALASYEQFARDVGDDEATRAGVAGAHFRMGKIYHRLGQIPEADAAYRRAIELSTALAADFPDVAGHRQALATALNSRGLLLENTGRLAEAERAYGESLVLQRRLVAEAPALAGYRQDLAATFNNLGLLLVVRGRLKEAEGAFRDALTIWRPLVADFPTEAHHRLQLARSLTNLGGVLRRRPKEAEDAYREALALQKQLAADSPDEPQYRQEWAATGANLANLLMATNRLTEAEAAYTDALHVQNQLAADFPTVPSYREQLARTRSSLAALLKRRGRRPEAEAAYREALAVRKRLAADYPAVADYQNDVAGTCVNLGNLLLERKEYASARRLYEEAVPYHRAALRASPGSPVYREFFRNNREALAEALVDLGDYRSAARVAAELAEAAVDPAGDTYNVAGYLARCVPLAEKDRQLAEGERRRLGRDYGDQALAALRRALRAGYKDVANLKKDPDLDALRGRDDFQKLLRDLDRRR